ncbi:hypothetical protein [Emcibacter sp. SYSU 3D8]|uniref:hypothetical protein n=1 Tax=Emcibacter sp. SYSU 3D8 TaxID=3133969 RepID=UPI0031FE47EC
MPHFDIETTEGGSVRRILRDGEPYNESVSLEPLFSVVTVYFQAAAANLHLLDNEATRERRRAYGVQSFVMSLTGVEAFTNTYFRLRANELSNQRMLERIVQRHGSLTNKIRELLAMTPQSAIEDQDMILDRVHALSLLRNDLVHPHWEPASMTIVGDMPLMIDGLVHNFQAAFENPAFCREALMWCVLLVAQIGRSGGSHDFAGFLFHWTGFYGFTEQVVLTSLGLGAGIAPNR